MVATVVAPADVGVDATGLRSFVANCIQTSCSSAVDNAAKPALSLNDAEKPRTRVMVLLVASDDPHTAQSWCPDCVVARPIVDQYVASPHSLVKLLVIVPVGSPTVYRNPQHSLRVDPLIAMRRVPTLLEWDVTTGNPLPHRLVEHEISPDSLALF